MDPATKLDAIKSEEEGDEKQQFSSHAELLDAYEYQRKLLEVRDSALKQALITIEERDRGLEERDYTIGVLEDQLDKQTHATTADSTTVSQDTGAASNNGDASVEEDASGSATTVGPPTDLASALTRIAELEEAVRAAEEAAKFWEWDRDCVRRLLSQAEKDKSELQDKARTAEREIARQNIFIEALKEIRRE